MKDLVESVGEAGSIEDLKRCLIDIVLTIKVIEAKQKILWGLSNADTIMDLRLKDNVRTLLELARAREEVSKG